MVAQPVEHNPAELAPVEEHAQVSRDQRVLLDRVSWELFEQILAADEERNIPRLAYDDGALELMTPSRLHERLSWNLALLVDRLTDVWEMDMVGTGSVTLKSAALRKALEPDSSFYIQHASQVQEVYDDPSEVDLPPDLVIEIEVSRNLVDRLPILAALGVPEIWRVESHRTMIYHLHGNEYVSADSSAALPLLTVDTLNELLALTQQLTQREWTMQVREWAAEASSQ